MEQLVTVIIPTYKRSPDIVGNAIKSVLNQTYKNIEVIVVDDSPNNFVHRDSMKELMRILDDSRLVYLRHNENLGACAARNTGIKESKGKFIAFLDDDDEWQQNKLEKQISLFENEKVGLVYSSIKEVTKKNGLVIKTYNRLAKYRGNLFKELFYGNFIGSISCAVFRRDVFEKVGVFDVNLGSAQDYEMYLRTSQKYEIDYADGDPLLIYYRHDGQRISDNSETAFKSREYIYEKYRNFIDNDSKLYNLFFLRRAVIHAEHHDYKNTVGFWLSAVQNEPINIRGNLLTLKDISKIVFKRSLCK